MDDSADAAPTDDAGGSPATEPSDTPTDNNGLAELESTEQLLNTLVGAVLSPPNPNEPTDPPAGDAQPPADDPEPSGDEPAASESELPAESSEAAECPEPSEPADASNPELPSSETEGPTLDHPLSEAISDITSNIETLAAAVDDVPPQPDEPAPSEPPEPVEPVESPPAEPTPPIEPTQPVTAAASTPDPEPELSPEDRQLDQILTAMIKRKILPSYSDRPAVIGYARKKSANLMLAEEYDEASSVDAAIDILGVSIQEDLCAQSSAQQAECLQKRLAEFKATEAKLNEDWSERVERIRARNAAKLEALRGFHAEERKQREAEWAAPQAKIPFLKPSSDLLQIRRQQKSSALLHDFETAKALKAKAESLERAEILEGAKRFQAAYKADINVLVERQQREISCLMATSEAALMRVAADRDKAVLAAERTKKSIEARLVTRRQLKMNPVMKPRTAAVVTPGMITVRTRTSLTAYRKSPETKRLSLPQSFK
jgi:hypothetical protein